MHKIKQIALTVDCREEIPGTQADTGYDWCDRQDGKKGFNDSDDEDDDDDFEGLFCDDPDSFIKTSQDRLVLQQEVRLFIYLSSAGLEIIKSCKMTAMIG